MRPARRAPRRRLDVADRPHLHRAAVGERTRRRRGAARRFGVDLRRRRTAGGRIDLRHREQQLLRVRMEGRRVDLVDGADLAELAAVQDADTV